MRNCTNCLYCIEIHEEKPETLNGQSILCGLCSEYDIYVCEFDRCSDWERRCSICIHNTGIACDDLNIDPKDCGFEERKKYGE